MKISTVSFDVHCGGVLQDMYGGVLQDMLLFCLRLLSLVGVGVCVLVVVKTLQASSFATQTTVALRFIAEEHVVRAADDFTQDLANAT
eukprot:2401487-Amphidinium_carterae.1